MSDSVVRPSAVFLPSLVDFNSLEADATDLNLLATDLGAFLAGPDVCEQYLLTLERDLSTLCFAAKEANPTAYAVLFALTFVVTSVLTTQRTRRERARLLTLVRERTEHQDILRILDVQGVMTSREIVTKIHPDAAIVRSAVRRLNKAGLIQYWWPPTRRRPTRKWSITSSGSMILEEVRATG